MELEAAWLIFRDRGRMPFDFYNSYLMMQELNEASAQGTWKSREGCSDYQGDLKGSAGG